MLYVKSYFQISLVILSMLKNCLYTGKFVCMKSVAMTILFVSTCNSSAVVIIGYFGPISSTWFQYHHRWHVLYNAILRMAVSLRICMSCNHYISPVIVTVLLASRHTQQHPKRIGSCICPPWTYARDGDGLP